VIPWIQLDRVQMPGGGADLRLMRRGAEFSIMLGSNELMNSRLSGSEEALASLACKRLRAHRSPNILIGGLGMGFTLRAAQGELDEKSRIVVAELVPAVVAWARGPMREIFGDCLSDPRVRILETEVGNAIRAGKAAYDAILLDVDNGPHGLTRSANDALYGFEGLAAARAAIRPGGVLAIWSSAPDHGFSQRLKRLGFSVEEIKIRANGTRGGARHIIWLATNGNAPHSAARAPNSRNRD